MGIIRKIKNSARQPDSRRREIAPRIRGYHPQAEGGWGQKSIRKRLPQAENAAFDAAPTERVIIKSVMQFRVRNLTLPDAVQGGHKEALGGMMRPFVCLISLAVAAQAADLPVREVILYKHGVGYFARSGRLGAGESARL